MNYHSSMRLFASLLLFTLFSGPLLAQDEGLWPIKVLISPAKQELLPGETMEVILTDLYGPDGNPAGSRYKIIVAAGGKIVNGENSVMPGGKAFLVGNGIIRIHYIAPATPSKDTDTIIVYRSYDMPDDLSTDPETESAPPPEEIGRKEVSVVQHNYLKVTQYEYYRYERKNSWSTKEIKVTAVVRFKPLGGAGTSIPYIVTSTDIVDFSGSIRTSDGEHADLMDATTQLNPATLMMHTEPGTIGVEAVVPSVFSASFSWNSSDGIQPPDIFMFAPVTEYDNKEEIKKLKAERKKIRAEMKNSKRPDIGKIMALQQKIASATTHPDHRVTHRTSLNQFGGKAEKATSSDTTQTIKRYEWEVVKK